ncbi:MAG: pyridoxal phosphate-dependent aminotransferase [Planctomycetota bacterium]
MTGRVSQIRLADRIGRVAESLTLAVTARALELKRQGIDVVGFGAGEPDFPTPAHVIEAATQFLAKGQVKYTASSGTPELKSAILHRLSEDHDLTYDAGNVLVSCGGKHALYLALQALCQKGDEVVIIAPYWVSYPEMVRLADAEPVIVSTSPAQDFTPDLSDIEAAITDSTRVIILNSPGNPTGAVYDRATLEGIARLAEKHDLVVFSDEIYEKLVYGDTEHVCFPTLPDMKDRTILFQGVSKAYSMTGWRIGWSVGPKDIISAMSKLQGQMTSNPASPSQVAAVAALTGPQEVVGTMREEFDARRRLIVDGLRALPGVTCPEPRGAFYVLPDVSGLYGQNLGGHEINGSLSFSAACLETANVALVAGVAFGDDRCVRLSYAVSREAIQKGLDRLRKLIEG